MTLVRSFRHAAEATALEVFARLATSLSRPDALALGRGAGRALHALGVRRTVALDNLRRSFPEWDERRVRKTARACYETWGQVAVDLLRAPRAASAGRWSELMHPVENLAAVREALGEGRGAILLTGHFGAFELFAAAVVREGIPGSTLVQPQSNPHVDRRLEAWRSALGLRPLRRGSALRDAMRALANNECLALAGDQDARARGVFVPFLGRLASTPRGPAELSLRTGAPIIMAVVVRDADGRHRPRFLPRLEFRPSGDHEADVERLTALHAATLETWVRAYPDHWYWLHRRWKTPPPAARKEPARAIAALAIAALALAAATPSRAAETATCSLLPLAETRVTRIVEDLRVVRADSAWIVEAVSLFQGGTIAETVPVGLPVFGAGADSLPAPDLGSVRLALDGVVLAPALEAPPAAELPGAGGLERLYTWRLPFAAEELKVVRLSFRIPAPPAREEDDLFFYYLNTGTPWRGASGRVNVRAELGAHPTEDLVAPWLRPVRFGVADSAVTWILSDEEPEGDVVLALRSFVDPCSTFADRANGPLALSGLEQEEWLDRLTPRQWRFVRAYVRARLGEMPSDPEAAARLGTEPWFRARRTPRRPDAKEGALLAMVDRRLREWEEHRIAGAGGTPP
jgi:KDO2-lipid IV(A) lauroyltransferase